MTDEQLGRAAIAAAFLALALVPASVAAQSGSSTASGFTRGYGAGLGGFEGAVNVGTRDASGAVNFVDGVLVAPQGSLFSSLSVPGAQTGSGAALALSAARSPAPLSVLPAGAAGGPATGPIVLNGTVNLDGQP